MYTGITKSCPNKGGTDETDGYKEHQVPQVDCGVTSKQLYRNEEQASHGALERTPSGDKEAPKYSVEVQTPKNELFYEKKRLETYYNEHIWPKSHCITAEELANSGFYYLGNLDRVRCAWCEGVLREWSAGDRAMEEHEYHFPECAFIQNIDGCGNVLIDPLNRPMRINNSSAVGPRHPQYSTYDARVKTYGGWQQDKPQTPHDLSQAGFFYAGREDYVRCFCCDGGLRYWSDEDDVWTEHARWFPHCEFLKENKGEAYIQSVRNQSSEKFQQQQSTGETLPEINQVMSKQAAERMARSRMDTPRVKLVLDLDYDKELVRKAIERQLERTGDDFEDATSLMNAILDLEEKEKQTSLPHATLSSSNICGATSHTASASPTKTVKKTSETSTPSKISETSAPSMPAQFTTKTSSQAKCNNSQKSAAPSFEESSVDLHALKQQVDEMKQNSTCKICMDKPISMVFIPCGHYIACTMCADAFRECPMCRCTIRGRVRAYMS